MSTPAFETHEVANQPPDFAPRDLHADDSHGFYTSAAEQLVTYAMPLERQTIAEWIREALADEEQEITGSERQARGSVWCSSRWPRSAFPWPVPP